MTDTIESTEIEDDIYGIMKEEAKNFATKTRRLSYKDIVNSCAHKGTKIMFAPFTLYPSCIKIIDNQESGKDKDDQ